MKPESYREQDGCWNCKKVFEQYGEYPGDDMFYICCRSTAPKQPPWDAPPDNRGGTDPWGICDEWEKERRKK